MVMISYRKGNTVCDTVLCTANILQANSYTMCSTAKGCIERLQDKIIIIILFLQHTLINSACLSFRLKNIQLCFIYIFCMWTDDRKYLYKNITLLENNNHMSPFHLDLKSFSIVTLVHIFFSSFSSLIQKKMGVHRHETFGITSLSPKKKSLHFPE